MNKGQTINPTINANGQQASATKARRRRLRTIVRISLLYLVATQFLIFLPLSGALLEATLIVSFVIAATGIGASSRLYRLDRKPD